MDVEGAREEDEVGWRLGGVRKVDAAEGGGSKLARESLGRGLRFDGRGGGIIRLLDGALGRGGAMEVVEVAVGIERATGSRCGFLKAFALPDLS